MKRILSVIMVAALMVAMLSVGAGSAFAKSAQSIENCFENIAKQNARGQTGAETGDQGPEDDKLAPTAVTNCDQFWGS
jgi:hypothetical protein